MRTFDDEAFTFKVVVNPYFEKKVNNFLNSPLGLPKTPIYSTFITRFHFLKNLKIPLETAN